MRAFCRREQNGGIGARGLPLAMLAELGPSSDTPTPGRFGPLVLLGRTSGEGSTERSGLGAPLPAAYEAMARAAAVVGDRGEAVAWRDRAREALERVADPADREVVEGDLATIPL